MSWLNAENILGAAGVLVTLAVLAYERLIPGLKRIGYRVQMDTPIGGDTESGQTNVRLGLFDEAPEMTDASLVLLRVENDGLKGIGRSTYESDGLTVTFAGRTVTGVAVTEPNPEDLAESLTPEQGLSHHGNKIRIPKVPLNKGDHFKLLVLLTGSGVGGRVTLGGTLNEGSIKRNRQQPRPSNLLLGVVVFLVLLVTVQQSMLWAGQGTDRAEPFRCAKGELTLVGSTAFAGTMKEIAAAYQADCDGATVQVAADGSVQGLRQLVHEGKKSREGAPAMIAMFDGKAGEQPKLRGVPVGVPVFVMVVNESAGVRGLSLAEVQKLFRGDIRNWSELGGRDVPVRLVGRTADSGTRLVFEKQVLHEGEGAKTSSDCVRKDNPRGKALRCELSGNDQVMRAVSEVRGAIGYGTVQEARETKGVTSLRLDGRAATPGAVDQGSYPFHAVEYAYTYGQPPADSLASAFLGYMSDGSAQNIIRTHGHLSCLGQHTTQLC